MLKKASFVLAAIAFATSVHAATPSEAAAAVRPVNGAALTEVVKTLSASTSVEVMAQAMVNASKNFDDIIVALRASGVPDRVISNVLYGIVPSAQLAQLDSSALLAGLPLPSTAAGPGSGGGAGFSGTSGPIVAPFVSSSIGGGAGGRAAASR